MQIDFKKYNADGIGCLPPPFPRVASYRRQPWATKSTTPMVLVLVYRFPNKQTKPPTHNPPKRNRRGGACVPARTFAQRRFHTKNTRMVRGEFNDGCVPAGRHGRAHRHRPYQSPSYFSTQSTPNETNRPRAIRPYQSPSNHAVCPYRVAVILSIAQGWQV